MTRNCRWQSGPTVARLDQQPSRGLVLARAWVLVVASLSWVAQAQSVSTQVHQAEPAPVSFEFHELDLRVALHTLAKQAGINLVVSDAVKGQVTLNLTQVPWRVALDAILMAKSLGMQQRQGVWWVAPQTELEHQEKREWARLKSLEALEPLVHAHHVLQYAKAAQVQAQLMGQGAAGAPSVADSASGPALAWPGPGAGFGAGAGAGASPTAGYFAGAPGLGAGWTTPGLVERSASAMGARLLSARGSVLSEPRTNQLFITDIAARVQAIGEWIARIDIPQRQVMIQAQVVEASTQFGQSLGVTLGLGDSPPGLSFPAASLNGQTPASALISVFPAGQQRRIAAALSALQASGEGEVLSHPRVVTADQVQAVIEQGTELPYQVSANHGGTSIAFRKANLKLEVTPHITSNDTIMLQVDLHKDSVGQLTAAGYAIDTKHLSTQVRIEDMGTVMIGGILERSQQDGRAGLPGTAKVPVLSWLFGNQTQQKNQRELLVFITPKILAERGSSP